MKVAKNGTLTSENKSANGRIYNYLHQLLSSGAIPAGQVISELQLSRTLGTSRSPIREAIGQLVSEGLLEQASNRSAMGTNVSREDIVDMFEVREALEIYAVRKVAGRRLLSEHIRTSLQERLEEFDLWKRQRAVMAHSLEMSELMGQSTNA